MLRRSFADGGDRDMLDMIKRMALTAEYREPQIKNHIERMRGYCQILARGMDLTQQEVDIIANASLLHDIGKVGLPERVAFKTDKLGAYEIELSKQHTVIGAEILRGSSSVYLRAAEYVCLTHHERWDGSGYPRGLTKEDIPLSGRITAIADVFDALTTRRSYKNEIPVEDALRLIRDSSGQLFDPSVVNVFVDSFDEILRVRQNNI
jgi:putative two-component system response regulator